MRASMEVYRAAAARIEAEPGFCNVRALPDRRDPALAQRAFEPADFDGVYARAAEAQAALVATLGDCEWEGLHGSHAKHAVATPDWFDGAVDPGVKGPDRAREKVANEYGGDASLLKDLARCTVHFADCGRLAEALGRLSGGVRVRQLKNKFASPTPMGYRDLSCVVELDLGDATPYLCEIQLHHDGMLAAKKTAHVHYEVVRSALPRICADAARGTAADAGALEGFVVGRLNTCALDHAVHALAGKADGLFLYATLLADHLAAERAAGRAVDFYVGS